MGSPQAAGGGRRSFREMSIIPPPEELLTKEEIAENRIGEPYGDAYEYLETQFRLLREDLLSSYRDAIRRLRSASLEFCGNGNMQLYTDVRLLGIGITRDGLEFGVSFRRRGDGSTSFTQSDDASSPFDWKNLKLLKHNTLLCISADGFRTFSFATVSSSVYRGATVGIRPVEGGGELRLDEREVYCMFECTNAYYESYYHALRVLQNPHMESIHFLQYFVHLRPNVENMEIGYHWKQVCRNASVDESQEAAIAHGVGKSLAIIQGPPGTGKTFTGLQIAQALLHAKLNAPLLVVCYTNRALDQFLEGIQAFEDRIVRLGSRTQSPVLAARTLNQLLRRENARKLGISIPEELKGHICASNSYRRSVEKTIRRKLLKVIESEDEILGLSERYDSACEASRNALAARRCHILREFKVVGMTATFAARNHDLICSLGSQVMIIEEAAEMTEAHALACLNPALRRLVLIGDHAQLRPSVACDRLAQTHKLNISLFERMVTSGVEFKSLGFQRRMRPQISALISPFYSNLRDHSSVKSLRRIRGLTESLLFIDHENPEEFCQQSRSICNPIEAQMAVSFCILLTSFCGYSPSDIAILSMYRAQVEAIGSAIDCIYADEETEDEEAVPRVRTVDEFQGEESKIVILSLVRNHYAPGIGFVGNPNRICVALSRAKEGLFIFGNAELLIQKSQLWEDIINQRLRSKVSKNGVTLCCPRHPKNRYHWNIKNIDRDYMNFCKGRCHQRLSCGHCCRVRCPGHRLVHPENVKCTRTCKKIMKCGHRCGEICHLGSACAPCQICLLERLLRCQL